MPSTTQSPSTPDSSVNPHLKNIDRSRYELSYLLRELPSNFHGHSHATPDTLLIVEAARDHADNATNTLIHGLEAVGEVLFLAGANDEYEVNARHISSIGSLISYVANDLQFLHETKGHLSYALQRHAVAVRAGLNKREGK
ncbi:MAG TPA: hypothetical protein VNW52_10360 [Burkholderiaceae bacterium]|jgi:hypothetical protein|nr:hypothetical protein [Burkholderiaceae bacterium]